MPRAYIDTPDIALVADGIAEYRWNGFDVPLATEHEFRRFVAQWGWNLTIAVVEGTLCTTEGGEIVDLFAAHGENATGATLYALSGWVWSTDDGGAK